MKDNQTRYVRTQGLWAVYENMTAAYLVAFALLLGASNTVVGLLASIPYIALLLSEFLGAKLTEYWARRPIILLTYAMDKLMWVFIALLPWFGIEQPLVMVVVFYFTARFLEGLRDPSTVTLVAEMATDKTRGQFVGRINRSIGIAGMVATLFAGWFIGAVGSQSQFTYALLFGIGALFGYAALWSFYTVEDKDKCRHKHYSLRDVLRVDGSFRRFCFRSSAFWFAAFIASPLVSAYMLRDLGMSTLAYGMASALQIFIQSIMYPRFGRMADKYGDRPVAIMGIMGTSLVTLLWFTITPETLWLVWPAQIVAGISWAAVEPALFNILIDKTNKEWRALQTAQFRIFTATAQAVGPVVGGMIADAPAFMAVSGIPLVLLLSTLLRAGSGLLFVQMHEPRLKKQYSVPYVFRQMAPHFNLSGPIYWIRSFRHHKN
jgi:MFS family permease